jgi:hypothetical protein
MGMYGFWVSFPAWTARLALVLLPEEEEGHVLSPHLGVDVGPVRKRAA